MSLKRIAILLRSELRLAVRDGEQLLLALGLPLGFLVFFSQVDALPTGSESRIDFIAPGIITLSLLSIGFVRPAIAIGFDRSFGAIKRFAITPLRVSEFLAAKLLANLTLFLGQSVIIVSLAVALGWRPTLTLAIVGALGIALVAFGAFAVVLSSLIDGLTSLAVANALYVVLLMVSGLVVDVSELPGALSGIAELLPTTALVSIVRSELDPTTFVTPGWPAWLVLTAWGFGASGLAVKLFRWE